MYGNPAFRLQSGMPLQGGERRRDARLSMSIPVHVHGYESHGDVWVEVSAAFDLCSGGASFLLEREVVVGQVLRLDLPLPRTLRSFDPLEPTHRVYALVRNVALSQNGYRVGTMFFGKHPPRGFEANPAGRFLLPWDVNPASAPAPSVHRPARHAAEPELPTDPTGRRRAERFDVLVNLLIQQADEWGEVLKEELTVTDDLGQGGAKVRTTLELVPGDVVLVRESGGPFEARAEVCGASLGADGVRRLHLKFLHGKAPMHLIRKR